MGKASTDLSGEPSVDLWRIFTDGKWRHLHWQADLLTARILTDVEFPAPWRRLRAWATADGVGIVPDDHPCPEWRSEPFGFELKGVNAFQYAKLVKQPLPKLEHAKQVARGMLLSGYPLWVVVYEDKSTQNFHEWVLTRKDLADQIVESQRELDELNNAVELGRLHDPLQSCLARFGPNWQGCQYAGRGGVCETAGTVLELVEPCGD